MHLFQQLDEDWQITVAGSDARRACLRWRRTEPLLAHVRCPEELVKEIRKGGDAARSDALLSVIVRLAESDETAARVVLQALIPGLVCLRRRLARFASIEDLDAAIVASAWERIRTYPHARRPHRIAANVLLDTRKAVSRTYDFTHCDPTIFVVDTGEPADDPADTLLVVLAKACERAILTAHEAKLIYDTRCGGISIAELASSGRVSVDALRRRRSRAELKLRAVGRFDI